MSTLFDERAVKYMTDLIRDFDLEDYQAAAIPGNFGEESGGFTLSQEIHPTSGRGGLGDGQWTGPRRVTYENWIERNADKKWDATTYEANYSMLFRELVGPEQRALAALKATRTLEEATEAFMDKYERPGVPALDVRISWARKALAAFAASGIDAAKLRSEDRPSSQPLPKSPQLPPLSDLQQVGTQLKPVMDQLLPMILPVLLNALQQSIQPGGKSNDLLSTLLPALGRILAPQDQQPPVIIQAPPAPTPVVVTPTPAKSAVEKPSVGLGLLGLFGSAVGMATGAVGTPFGMGANPTTAGTLAIIIPAAISMIGATGIFGPVGSVVARMAGAAFATAQKK